MFCLFLSLLTHTHTHILHTYAAHILHTHTHTQVAMIEGVHLAIHHMSTRNGGHGGVVINTASVAGPYYINHTHMYRHCS